MFPGFIRKHFHKNRSWFQSMCLHITFLQLLPHIQATSELSGPCLIAERKPVILTNVDLFLWHIPESLWYKPHHIPNLNDYRLVLKLSFRNPLKPGVKSRMKMNLEQRRQAMLQLHPSPKVMVDFSRHKNQRDTLVQVAQFLVTCTTTYPTGEWVKWPLPNCRKLVI